MTNRGEEDSVVIRDERVRDDTGAGGEIYELVKTRSFIAINIAGVRSDTDRSSPPPLPPPSLLTALMYINVSCKYCKYIV